MAPLGRSLTRSFSSITKLFYGTAFLASVVSVASIADNVYKFKGFITTAIATFRFLTAPLIAMLDEWMAIQQAQVDVMVFSTLVLAANYRVGSVDTRLSTLKWYERAMITMALWISLAVLAVVVSPWWALFSLCFPLLLITSRILPGGEVVYEMQQRMFGGRRTDRHLYYAKVKLLWGQVLATLLVFGILAAISEGLVRGS